MPAQSYRPQQQNQVQGAQAAQQQPEREENNVLERVWNWFTDLFSRDEETPTLAAAQSQQQGANQAPAQETDQDEAADLNAALQQITAEGTQEEQDAALQVAEAVEAQPSPYQKAADLEKVQLAKGTTYKVSADDMAQPDPWTYISQNKGMKPAYLQAFNQHIEEVNLGVQDAMSAPVSLNVGVEIYIPSAQEILFAQARQKTKTYDEAVALWGQLSEGANVKMMDAARLRSSGEVGKAYGTQGVDGGSFYTANKDVAGAKASNSKKVGGQTEYKVFWVADFWKCSLFLHDVVFQAGYKPDLKANKHYQLAGKLQESPGFTEIPYDKAMPGDAYQRYGGTQSNESHNAVLSNFPTITDLGDGTEQVQYDIIGASKDRADEGYHDSIVKKGTSDVVAGYGQGGKIRFFRPTKTR